MVGASVVVGVGVVVEVLPHTGSPGSAALSFPPARNNVGTHTPIRPAPTQAHQWLVRLPSEYFDPLDWHTKAD